MWGINGCPLNSPYGTTRHYIVGTITQGSQRVWNCCLRAVLNRKKVKDILSWYQWLDKLTHWGRVTHICVSYLTIIGSNNGLSPGRRQAIIWTNAGILLIGTLRTNFSEIISEIHTFLLKKMHLKTSSAKWRPFCLGLNVLTRMSEPCTMGILWNYCRF